MCLNACKLDMEIKMKPAESRIMRRIQTSAQCTTVMRSESFMLLALQSVGYKASTTSAPWSQFDPHPPKLQHKVGGRNNAASTLAQYLWNILYAFEGASLQLARANHVLSARHSLCQPVSIVENWLLSLVRFSPMSTP